MLPGMRRPFPYGSKFFFAAFPLALEWFRFIVVHVLHVLAEVRRHQKILAALGVRVVALFRVHLS